MLILSRNKSIFIARGNVYTCRPNNDNFETNGAPYMCSAIVTSAIEATPTQDGLSPRTYYSLVYIYVLYLCDPGSHEFYGKVLWLIQERYA